MTAAIATHGLGKRYRQLWALADCTLSVPAGHVVGLVGPNGAGKTTLLRIAAGMTAPTAGTIEVLGRYWPFQATETGIYLALALILTGFCFRRLNRRLI
jgi:ABC-type multidrug transport system ATPase subunit